MPASDNSASAASAALPSSAAAAAASPSSCLAAAPPPLPCSPCRPSPPPPLLLTDSTLQPVSLATTVLIISGATVGFQVPVDYALHSSGEVKRRTVFHVTRIVVLSNVAQRRLLRITVRRIQEMQAFSWDLEMHLVECFPLLNVCLSEFPTDKTQSRIDLLIIQQNLQTAKCRPAEEAGKL